MAATRENRKKFIESAISFMDTYGYDGINLDWEYVGIEYRGGSVDDSKNYGDLLQEMHDAF